MPRSIVTILLLANLVSCREGNASELSQLKEAICAPGEELKLPIPKERFRTPRPGRPDLSNMTRDSMLFYISAFATEPPLIEELSEHDVAVLPCSSVVAGVVEDLRDASAEGRYITVMRALKEILKGPSYNAARNLNRTRLPIPDDLTDFARVFPFLTWDRRVIPVSVVKNQTRILYCRYEFPRISIAQTHDSMTGDPSSSVRETEIMIEREDGSGHWDYFVYDDGGSLANESEFHNSGGGTSRGNSPFVCATCHYHPEERLLQNRPLTYGGMPYQDRFEATGCTP